MPEIVTITLNPAVDKSIMVPALIADRKLYCTSPVYEPGGGGINVARAIIKLGGTATAIYLGGGHSGRFFESLLKAEEVPGIMVPVKGRTRENLVVTDNSNHQQYRFDMPGPLIAEHEWQDCLDKVRQLKGVAYIVASGSLPPGVPPEIFASFSAIANILGARFIADTAGEALKEAIREGAYLLKPNVRELSAYAETELLNEEEITTVAKDIIARKRCQVIIVSLGDAGALVVAPGITKKIAAPFVRVKSVVGAGDSMLAGIVYGLSQGKELLKAAQYGVACGSAATMSLGTGLCKLEDVTSLHEQVCNQPQVESQQ